MSQKIYLKSKLDHIISCLKHFKSSAATAPWSWNTGPWSAPTYFIIFITAPLCLVFHAPVIRQFVIFITRVDFQAPVLLLIPFPLPGIVLSSPWIFLLYNAYLPELIRSHLLCEDFLGCHSHLAGLGATPPPHPPLQTSFQCWESGGGEWERRKKGFSSKMPGVSTYKNRMPG